MKAATEPVDDLLSTKMDQLVTAATKPATVACVCGLCKEQLGQPWVLPCVDVAAQPRYGQNKECTLWPSYEGANNWKICQLVPKMEVDKKEAQELHNSIFGAMEARMSLMIHEGKMGAIGMADEVALGYYVGKWLSDSYTLQKEMAEGMSGMIGAGRMVTTCSTSIG